MITFEWAPSVPVNRDEVGGNVLLNNGALPLGTTHFALASPLIKGTSSFFKESNDATSWLQTMQLILTAEMRQRGLVFVIIY